MPGFELFGQVPSQKNSKQIFINKRTGKPFITSSAKVKEWQVDAGWQLKMMRKCESYPIELDLHFYVADKRSRDLDNMCSSVLDALRAAGIILDDDWQHVRRITLSAEHDGLNPRVVISTRTV